MLLSSYHIVLPNFEKEISAFSLNARRNFSEHPRYDSASDFESHVFLIGSTFPVFLSRAIIHYFNRVTDILSTLPATEVLNKYPFFFSLVAAYTTLLSFMSFLAISTVSPIGIDSNVSDTRIFFLIIALFMFYIFLFLLIALFSCIVKLLCST